MCVCVGGCMYVCMYEVRSRSDWLRAVFAVYTQRPDGRNRLRSLRPAPEVIAPDRWQPVDVDNETGGKRYATGTKTPL